jgi:hypothetical protein
MGCQLLIILLKVNIQLHFLRSIELFKEGLQLGIIMEVLMDLKELQEVFMNINFIEI